MKINVHAGHANVGQGAIGAVGILNESVENRKVKDVVIRELRALGHTVYDCTFDTGDANTNLRGIVSKCNAHEVDLDVSIHFNSYTSDLANGTEVWLYNANSKAKTYAEKVLKEIVALGFTNRGIKYSTGLYVLRSTNAPAMLVECCFVTSKRDANLYDPEKMGKAIVKGITGQTAVNNSTDSTVSTDSVTNSTELIYRVQVGAFKNKANADNLLKELKAKGFEGVVVSGN